MRLRGAHRRMNLPNALTRRAHLPRAAARRRAADQIRGTAILGVPKEFVGAAIFGLASLTDWLDGYLARRRRQITALGQMIDPSPTSC